MVMILADRLHMTVADVLEKVTVPEFILWCAYLKKQEKGSSNGPSTS